MDWTRREFVFVIGAGMARLGAVAPPRDLRVGVIASGTSDAELLDGITFGLEEARHTASLVGWAVHRVESRPDEASGAHAVLAASQDPPDVNVPVLHLTCASARTPDNLLIHPSVPTMQALLLTSLRADESSVVLRTDHAQRLVRGAAGATPALVLDASCHPTQAATGVRIRRVVTWHPSLTRYGARQLRDRYLSRFGREMSHSAWMGWFGVKTVWESAVRVRGALDEGLGDRIRAGRYDGHKGQALAFEGNELSQPLYVVERAPGETEWTMVPEPGA